MTICGTSVDVVHALHAYCLHMGANLGIGGTVHRQLVSQTLESTFRRSLELTIADRLRQAGRSDEASEAIARMNEETQASAVSQRTPRLSARANDSKELRELKSEVAKLKNLMKLSFELQMDMQRSLKQEISALTNGTFSNTASNSLIKATTVPNSKDGKCIICTESNIDTVFYKCGHMCVSLAFKQQQQTYENCII